MRLGYREAHQEAKPVKGGQRECVKVAVGECCSWRLNFAPLEQSEYTDYGPDCLRDNPGACDSMITPQHADTVWLCGTRLLQQLEQVASVR